MRPRFSIAVLAGGESSRLERNKALELLAVISDRADEAADVPVFGFDDIEAVANLIVIRYGLDRGGRIREARA